MYPSIAAALKTAIVKALGRSDFLYLINSHFHWDHTGGNQAFSEATIIGHAFTPMDMKKFTGDNFPAFLEERRKIIGNRNDPGELEQLDEMERNFLPAPPTECSDERKTLTLSDMTIVLYHVGKDGASPSLTNHTRSDIFIFVPEERVLCAAGVYFPKEWLTVLPPDQLAEKHNGFLAYVRAQKYQIEKVIFGHDPMISK